MNMGKKSIQWKTCIKHYIAGPNEIALHFFQLKFASISWQVLQNLGIAFFPIIICFPYLISPRSDFSFGCMEILFLKLAAISFGLE
jgi:hypothetical protein